MQAQMKRPLAERKAALQVRLAALNARLQTIEAELEAEPDRDWEEAAVEREDDEVLEATGLVGQRELRQIEAALHRIDVGEYGVCVRCGNDISEARLDALPHTAVCRECAT